MNELQSLAQELARVAAGGFWKTVLTGVVFAAAGFAAGVALVVYAGRRGLLRRDLRPWAWVARVNYVYVPVVLALFLGSLGGVYGAQRVVGSAIDRTTAPVVSYAQAYLPTLQAALAARLPRNGAEATVETLIAEQMGGGERNPFVREAMFRLNLALVHHALDQVQLPEGARGSMDALRHVDLAGLGSAPFQALPRALHQASSSFFAAKYAFVLMLFAPLLLLPVAEYLAHAGWRWSRRRAAGLVHPPS
ncbi:MAG TPA: hypothetical protein VHG08_12715 [Longimicrobium sp.]|nr:hypothetical protein [Longimicrobium sp.]